LCSPLSDFSFQHFSISAFAKGWPWGGFGWLRATSFLVSAFSFQHFSFCPIVAWGGFAQFPLGPGERERHMQIELACRYYGRGWLSLSQAARLAALDQYAFGVELGERGIPRQYGLTEAQEDIAHAGRQ
jgi:predicted HTH domain antitoxin